MPKFIIPKKSSRVNLDFFKRHADAVAKDLLGRVFVSEGRKNIYLRLEEVAAFEGEAESELRQSMFSRYPGIFAYPGTLAISTKFGQNLIHISTLDINKPSCINLIAGTIFDKKGYKEYINGPGNLTYALKIDKSYNGVHLNFHKIWIGGQSIEESQVIKRNKSGVPKNCKGYFYFK